MQDGPTVGASSSAEMSGITCTPQAQRKSHVTQQIHSKDHSTLSWCTQQLTCHPPHSSPHHLAISLADAPLGLKKCRMPAWRGTAPGVLLCALLPKGLLGSVLTAHSAPLPVTVVRPAVAGGGRPAGLAQPVGGCPRVVLPTGSCSAWVAAPLCGAGKCVAVDWFVPSARAQPALATASAARSWSMVRSTVAAGAAAQLLCPSAATARASWRLSSGVPGADAGMSLGAGRAAAAPELTSSRPPCAPCCCWR